MFCPVHGLTIEMKEIQEFDGYTLVTRNCSRCGVDWILRHEDKVIVSIIQAGEDMSKDFGFDYKCPHCGYSTWVATVFQTKTGWKCLQCGRIVPNENITPRGGFELLDYRAPAGTSVKGRRQRMGAVPGYQRAPRTSRPLPVGSVGIKEVAERVGVEPKKLRSWLRKVGWRKPEEAKSSWVFSKDEIEEIAKNFGK